MFKSEHGSADEGLAEFVAEIGGAIRSLDEYLFGGLVKPLAHRENLFPVAQHDVVALVAFQSGIGGHVYGGTGDGP